VATQAPPPNSDFLAVKYWPTWLGIGLLCLVAWLPLRLRLAAGALLGRASWLLVHERRYITEINIRLCFPELSAHEQADLVYQAFIENGKGLIETATGWVRPAGHFRALLEMPNPDAIPAALAQGRGVLLLGGHYSTLDFSANLLSLVHPFAPTYRAHKNPVFDAFMLRGRIRNCNGVFDRKDIRGAFRHLKAGKILWYAPDQDYGPEQAVYAPFFGLPAATITAGSRFANFNKSPVIIISHRRDASGKKYILDTFEPPAPFPTGDDVQDATLINQVLEQEIRKAPAQYLWMHKRFKTQPGGKPQSPYIFIGTPKRELDMGKYGQLTTDASAVPAHSDRLQLGSGLQLWSFQGLARGWFARSHPALRLDHLSKWLRAAGVATVTTDNIFFIPHLHATGVTVFVPAGLPLTTAQHVAPEALAGFLAAVHRCGCSFIELGNDNLLWDGVRLALLNPLVLRQLPGAAAQHDRYADLCRLPTLTGFTPEQTTAFLYAYLQGCRSSDRTALEERLAAAGTLPHNHAHTTTQTQQTGNQPHDSIQP
jgi:KDO2-lipid IV(A) lauroyltransferase